MNLPLNVKVDLLPKLGGFALDCRMLFMGERVRQLVRTYEEVVYRFKRFRDPERLFDNLQGSDEIKQFYQIERLNGITSVLLRPCIFEERGTVDDLDIDVQFEYEHKTFIRALPLEKVRSLGCLLPLLRQDLGRDEIQNRLAVALAAEEKEWVLELFSMLTEKGFLEEVPLPRNYFHQELPHPRVTFLGHSSLLFQSAQAAAVADPMLRLQLRLPDFGMDAPRLKLDAVIISHSHWDHCDLQSLLWFDKDTEVIIPRVKHPTIFNPPMVEAMRLIGFTRIREVDLWEPVQIKDIELIPVPFHGEQDEPDAHIDHFTYVLRTKGLSVYGGVDSYRDTFGQMMPVLNRIREDYHPDLAFLPVSKMIYRYEWGGVNGFCRYLDTNLIDQAFQYTASAEDAADWVTALQPKWVAPYATFNFSRWSTPAQVSLFENELRRRGLQTRLYPFRPFDSLEASDFATGNASDFRRKTLLKWFRFGSKVSSYDKRLQKNRIYRYLRYRMAASNTPTHH
jgi:L-ascorbate metabolism protein UlaG (beta-lactamase superfamily)